MSGTNTNEHFLCSQLSTTLPSGGENPNKAPLFMYDLGSNNPSSLFNQTLDKLKVLNGTTCRMLCVGVIADLQSGATLPTVCDPPSSGVKCCYDASPQPSNNQAQPQSRGSGANTPGGLTTRVCTAGTVAALREGIISATNGETDKFYFYPDGKVSFYKDGTKVTIPTVIPSTQSQPANPADVDDAADWGRLQRQNTTGNSYSLSQSSGAMLIPNYTMGYLLFDEGRAKNAKPGTAQDRILILYNPMHRNEMINYLSATKSDPKQGLSQCAKVLSSYAAAVVTKSSTKTVNGTYEIFGDPMGNLLWQISSDGTTFKMSTNNKYIVGNATTGQNSAFWNNLDLSTEMGALKDDGSAYCISPCVQWVTPSGGTTIKSNNPWLPGTSVPVLNTSDALNGAPADVNNAGQVAATAIFWWIFTNQKQTASTTCKFNDQNVICNTMLTHAGSLPTNPFCSGRPKPGDKTKHTTMIILGIVLGILAIVGLGAGGWYLYKKRKK